MLKKNKIAIGQIVLDLNQMFTSNADMIQVYHKLELFRKEEHQAFNESDLPHIMNYLSILSVMSYLEEKRILKFETLDKLFALRFFLAINNPYIQHLCMEEQSNYKSLIALYEKWLNYRRKKGLSEPLSSHSLSLILGRSNKH